MARTRGAVYGEEGTISGALKEREAHLAELMDPLKPKMDLLIAGLDLRAGIKKLLEAVDMTATSLMHTSANDIRDWVAKIVKDLIAEEGKGNLVLLQAQGGQPTHLEDALKTRVRGALSGYGRQRLRDKYVSTYEKTYAPEIAAGDLRVVPGLPDEESGNPIHSIQDDLSKVVDRSFCLVSASRTVFVTIERKDFTLRVAKTSSGTMADGFFEGGSWVRGDTDVVADTVRHFPELRYFARHVVGDHADLPDMAKTYELYTQERSHDIAKDMAHMVERAFPLYARWKKSHKLRQHPRQENTRWHGETTKVVDEAIAQQYGKMSKSPTWAMERDIVGPQMSMIAKSYMTWYAMSAMREIRGAMREFEAENEKAGKGFVAAMLYDTRAAEATITRKRKEFGNIIAELSAAIPGQQAAPESSINEAEAVWLKTMNFVQMLLGDAIRAKLRESRMKPFFDKLEAIYRIDPQVGALKDGVVTIPSAAHVKIALGNPDGTPLHTGYAAIGASARGGAFMSPRRDVTRLEVSEFARLILMSLPHLSDSRKDGAMSVGIDEIYGKFMEAETISRFGKLPDDQQTLHPHLSWLFRIHDYRLKNDPHT